MAFYKTYRKRPTYRKKRKYKKKPVSSKSNWKRKGSFSLNKRTNSTTSLNHFSPKCPFPRKLGIVSSVLEIGEKLPTGGWASGYLAPYGLVRLNSLFDPLYTTGVGQLSASYHNIYQTYYSNYRVNYTKVEILISGADHDCVVQAGISDQASQIPTAASTIESLINMPNVQTVSVESDQGSRFARRKLTFNFSMKSWWKRNSIGESSTQSAVSTSPVVQPVLWLAVFNRDGSTGSNRLQLDVQGTFYAQYMNRKLIAIANQ